MWQNQSFRQGLQSITMRPGEAAQQSGQQNQKINTKTVLTCRYCKKEGHELEECRKKKYVNSKREQAAKEAASENQNAGKEEEPNTSRARSVQQIQSAIISLQRPTTSSQQH